MNFDLATLGSGEVARAIELLPNEALWFAVILIVMAALIVLMVIKAVRDRKVLELKPVTGAARVLLFISFSCFIGALLVLFL